MAVWIGPRIACRITGQLGIITPVYSHLIKKSSPHACKEAQSWKRSYKTRCHIFFKWKQNICFFMGHTLDLMGVIKKSTIAVSVVPNVCHMWDSAKSRKFFIYPLTKNESNDFQSLEWNDVQEQKCTEVSWSLCYFFIKRTTWSLQFFTWELINKPIFIYLLPVLMFLKRSTWFQDLFFKEEEMDLHRDWFVFIFVCAPVKNHWLFIEIISPWVEGVWGHQKGGHPI